MKCLLLLSLLSTSLFATPTVKIKKTNAEIQREKLEQLAKEIEQMKTFTRGMLEYLHTLGEQVRTFTT